MAQVKIKLEECYALVRDDGETQNFFGVPFTCKNKKMGKNKIKSEWFTELDANDAKAMVEAGRVDILKG